MNGPASLIEEQASEPQPPRQLIEFLIAHDASSLAHSDATLLQHLIGTWRLLAGWGMDVACCNAGLFHSVYGTEVFRQTAIALDERNAVAHTIGPEAEYLAYVFGMMERASFFDAWPDGQERIELRNRLDASALAIDTAQYAALAHILLANFIEQMAIYSPALRQAMIERFLRVAPHLNAAAQEALATSAQSAGVGLDVRVGVAALGIATISPAP